MKKLNFVLVISICAFAVACSDPDTSNNGQTHDQDVNIDTSVADVGVQDTEVDAVEEPDATTDTALEDECEIDVALDCIGDASRNICQNDGLRNVIIEEACTADSTCVLGACVTPEQVASIAQINVFIDNVKATSGNPSPTDFDALRKEATIEFLKNDDVKTGLVAAVTRFTRSFGHGHQGVQFGDNGELCGDVYPYSAQTNYAGICGKPHGNEVLVTGAKMGNTLGLAPGDVIISTDRWAGGENFLDNIAQAPGCLTRVGATLDSDRAEAAASLFGKIGEGMTLKVRNTDGVVRTVNVPAHDIDIPAGEDFCLAPFGGYSFEEGLLTIRPDGVAVIKTSTLRPQPWTNAETYYAEVQNFIDRVAATVATVPDGAPIIWDIRGNSGGSAEVAYGIVAGMPGAVSAEMSRAYRRVKESDPATWEIETEPFQSQTMTVSDDLTINHRDHKVAVLIDGQTVSAADHFAYGAKNFADAIIIGPEGTAGMFGFGGDRNVFVEGPVFGFWHRVDPFKVVDKDGGFLEGQGVQPDFLVAYDPKDVAAGIDTVLETAATKLLE